MERFSIMWIDPFWFIVSLGIGLFYVYLTTRTPEIIIKYPTPENAGTIVYHDSNDVCYKYRAVKVDCPINKSLIKQIPIQK
ncbi:unnamed protein product [marine sediment metagenome]|uniref:Uncharacterized protein n=1 Tax=marine sediment metagenome TaxID=412755 RepID=X0YAV4_9ZZZZ